MKWFKKKNHISDPVEDKFVIMMDLIKNLSKADYNRLKKAMDLGWQSYQTIRNVKTEDEKEVEDIVQAELHLTKEFENDK